jgi:hypothetical protein
VVELHDGECVKYQTLFNDFRRLAEALQDVVRCRAASSASMAQLTPAPAARDCVAVDPSQVFVQITTHPRVRARWDATFERG